MNRISRVKKGLLLLGTCLILTLAFTYKAPKEEAFLILATTTSVMDSGLLDYLLPVFKEETGIEARVIAVGTGKALQLGRDGEADALLVHSKKDEEAFVKEGHGLKRYDLMYNDFVLLGPKSLEVSQNFKASKDLDDILESLKKGSLKFVSRGDDSGTHKKELSLWKNGLPEGENYYSAGKGMGEVLQMANELEAFTLSDRGTFLSMREKLNLEIVYENKELLKNQYGVIAVNPNKNKKIHQANAQAFIEWILSEKTQELIGRYGLKEYGESLFVPNAK